MLSYHNDPAVKAKYIARFEAHRAADEVIQGTGFNNGSGCFVGCTLDNYDHSRFPVELGWPEWLARLADTIFEGLPKTEAPQFGTDLLASVPVGLDLEAVRVPFLVAVQQRNLARLEGHKEQYTDRCLAAIQGVIDFLLAGEPAEGRESARASAESAESAARSAAWSAESAAWSAESAESAAWSAAWSAESQAQRDTLLALLRAM
jgi:hypothetical protein